MNITSTEMALLAVRAMLVEAENGLKVAHDNLDSNYLIWYGKVMQCRQFISYLEKVEAQENHSKITLSESYALMNKESLCPQS